MQTVFFFFKRLHEDCGPETQEQSVEKRFEPGDKI